MAKPTVKDEFDGDDIDKETDKSPQHVKQAKDEMTGFSQCKMDECLPTIEKLEIFLGLLWTLRMFSHLVYLDA